MTDLFGDPVYGRRVGRRLPGAQLEAFGGAEWMGGATDCAAALGLAVLRMEAGRRVLTTAGWFAVVWDDGHGWTLQAEVDQCPRN